MVQDSGSADGESNVTMAGTVEKVIRPLHPNLPGRPKSVSRLEMIFTERFASIVW